MDEEDEWFLREQSRIAARDMLAYVKGHLTRLTRGLVRRWYLFTASRLLTLTAGKC